MVNPPTKSNLTRELAINLASLGIPLSFFAGYQLGIGNWHLGLGALICYLILDNITGRLWFKVLEKMHNV